MLQEADVKVTAFKERWTVVHECFKEWVARMTTLVSAAFSLVNKNLNTSSDWSIGRVLEQAGR